MNCSGSPLPGRQGGKWRRRWLPAALLGATLLLAPPAVAAADHEGDSQRFPTSAEACDYIATQARDRAFLCATALPPRVVSDQSRFVVEDANPRSYTMGWRPQKGRSRLMVQRMPKSTLKLIRRILRKDGVRTHDVELRGGAGVRACLRGWCMFAWRERSSTYFSFGRHKGVSRTRLRGELHAVARALHLVQPNPGPPPPPPPEPDSGSWRFGSSAAACDFIAGKARRPPVLCPPALPPRLTARGRFNVLGLFERPERWYLAWTPRKTGGMLILARDPERALRKTRAAIRRSGGRIRAVRVRGRRAMLTCAPRQRRFEGVCYLAWRELGSTYSVLRLAELSLPRLRRDVRAVARSLEPVSASGASQAAASAAPRVLQR